jgi:hypothetical protein
VLTTQPSGVDIISLYYPGNGSYYATYGLNFQATGGFGPGATGPAGPQGSTGPTGPTGSAANAQRESGGFNSTVATPTGPSALSFPVKGLGNYAFLAELLLLTEATGPSGGVKLGVGVPSGVGIAASILGAASGINVMTTSVLNSGSLAPQLYAQASGIKMPASLSGVITPSSATATGLVQIYMGVGVSGQTGTILDGSFLVTFPSN